MTIKAAIKEARAGGGVPRTRIIIDVGAGTLVVWQPDGEVKTLRRKAMTKIGDTLWTHPYGRPEKISIEQGVISGETKFSWLVGDPKFNRYKVSKKQLHEAIPGYMPRQWYTEQGKEDRIFIAAYRHQISGAILSCQNVAQLKKIAEIIGMELA